MRTRISDHFYLDEFTPAGLSEVEIPGEVIANIEMLVTEILEPARSAIGIPFHIHSGYRPPAKNVSVGGKPASDHLLGDAADFHVGPSPVRTWEQSTIFAFQWMRTNLEGHFGQLILEDHRTFYSKPSKLWIHVSNPTARHPGTPADVNRLLFSYSPTEFRSFDPANVPTA